MRNGQNHNNNKNRMRGRNRGKSHNPMTRVYESNGPDVKIRGTASHLAEKYVQLARDAQSSGDPVAAENYYQHAEHYFRMIAAAQEQFRQNQPNFTRPDGSTESVTNQNDDGDDDGMEEGTSPSGQNEPGFPRDYQPQNFGQQNNYSGDQNNQQHNQQRGGYQGNRDNNNRGYQGNRDNNNRGYQGNRDNQQPRDYQQRDNQQPRDFNNQQPQQRDQQPRPPQPSAEQPDVNALPSFITGGAPQSQAAAPQNGHDGQGDGFQRRGRRPRGPRQPREGQAFGNETADEGAPTE